MYVYTALTLGTILVAVVKSVYFMLFFTVASKNLHDFIFSKMIKATMTFYNANPSGRILNRFSKDLGIIDEYIPSVLVDVIEVSNFRLYSQQNVRTFLVLDRFVADRYNSTFSNRRSMVAGTFCVSHELVLLLENGLCENQ